MKYSTAILASCLSLVGSATAAPTASKSTKYDITFDERAANPILPLAQPVGIEDTIFFNAWALNRLLTTIGVVPHSSPNSIVTASEQQATNGTPSLTTLYPNSTIKSFDLFSFFFGCALNSVESAADVAVACDISVKGFRSAHEVASAKFSFTPPFELEVPMIEAVLPKSFRHVDNVTIIQDDPFTEVIVADNFNVTTHS